MFDQILFIASAILTCGGAIMVVAERNLMHACVYLLGSLIGMAGLYITLNADFIAATQLVVYVGGVVVLMLFAVMLTGGNPSNANERNRFGLESVPAMGNLKTYIVGTFTAIVFLLVALKLISSISGSREATGSAKGFSSTVEEIGIKLVTDHILVFEISSVLLLGALVGAAIIARPERTSVEGGEQ